MQDGRFAPAGERGPQLFGMLKPCAHGAAAYGIEATAWQTHLCGLCLGLRDGHGQLARAATNTDALVLGILTEAQQQHSPARTTAAPCPLRGMRRAAVATADSPGVQLAATASLLLGAAKIRDHVDDGQTGRLTTRPMARVSTRWHAQARAAAAPIGLDIEPLIAAIESQARLEHAVAVGTADPQLSGDSQGLRPRTPDSEEDSPRPDTPRSDSGEGRAAETLDRLTEPTQVCAAELFAHTAILAGRPENADALREAGWHFGRIAHLADAIEDFEDDRERGRFNPLAATGTTVEVAYALLRESNSALRAALSRVALEQAPTVRWMLLDPLHGVVKRIGRAAGGVRACTAHACRSDHADEAPHAGGAHGGIRLSEPALLDIDTVKSPRSHKPSILEGIGIVLTQYCTGYACCAEHTRPCSGKRKESWTKRGCADCGCDCCSGCDGKCCGDGCCCDGCCCDC
ncbi:DUF5685 family protein [Nocardia acididurans]|uniref:DUF5685 family protein n=1 Tax=Nocardia acididurans TaxID=2802282 RepID=UPI0022B7FA2F|nr:DUF5685 family protein [Nocardia acididurans]